LRKLRELSVAQTAVQYTTTAASFTVHIELRPYYKDKKTARCDVDTFNMKNELLYELTVNKIILIS